MTPFERTLALLAERRPPTPDLAPTLSALSARQGEQFRAVFQTLPVERRLELLRMLDAEAERNLELDFTPVFRVALGDPSPEVRRLAIELSSADESEALLAALLALVRSDPDPSVRAAAADELGRFALAAELGALDEHDGERIRAELLATARRAGEEDRVRGLALASAGYFSAAEVADAIRAAYAEPALRPYAIRAMGRTAEPDWSPGLLRELQDRDPVIRAEAARALGEIEDERAVKPLVDLVDDEALPVRLAAIAALGHIGGQRAREALVYAAQAPEEAVRAAAEEALSEIDFWEDPLAL